MNTGQKIDYKKEYKDLYLPPKKPVLVTVPSIPFIMVDGAGAPESAAYQNAVSVLYGLSFTIKMSKMGGQQPEGYHEYVVPPLEGLWDSDAVGYTPNRDAWTWTSMIRQPGFVTPAVFEWAKQQAAAKKPKLDFSAARFAAFDEGLCVQMMHIGPYSTEAETVKKISQYIKENNLAPDFSLTRRHHEIYLGDPRKVAPERLKTVLRHPVKMVD